MNARERNILIATVVIIIGALAFSFFGGDEGGDASATTATSGSLKTAQKQFTTNVKTLKEAGDIRQNYKAIEIGVTASDTNSRRPEAQLANQLYDLLKDRLHVPNPNVGTAVFTRIARVDEYCYIDIPVDISGDYGSIMNLLKEMNDLGLLIKSFKINQRSRNEGNMVDLNITVSRLVKVDDMIRKRLLRTDRQGGA